MSLYCLFVDIFGAFDNIVHSQALFSLASSDVNTSVLFLLPSCYSKSKFQVTWNGQISDPVKINKGVRQGAVLSPSIFKCVFASCLRHLKSSVFYGNIGLSSVAYEDDVLLVAQTRRGLLSNFIILTNELSKIGLSVNASKCEFICFNSPYVIAPFVAGIKVLPCSSLVSWLGLCFGPPLSNTCSSLENKAVKNLSAAHGKISPNKSRYTRNGLCLIYNAYCAPVLLLLPGMAHLFRKKDCHTLRVAYFRYCKLLLRLPRWHRNRKIIARFGLIDVPFRIRSSSDDLCKKTINFIHVYDHLQPFFHIDTG